MLLFQFHIISDVVSDEKHVPTNVLKMLGMDLFQSKTNKNYLAITKDLLSLVKS